MMLRAPILHNQPFRFPSSIPSPAQIGALCECEVQEARSLLSDVMLPPLSQRRLVFCLDENKLPALCTASTATQEVRRCPPIP